MFALRRRAIALKACKKGSVLPILPTSPKYYSSSTVKMTVREALNQTLDSEMRRNKNIVMMGEEIALYNGAYKVTKGLLEKHGEERIIDMPITESGFGGVAVGAAMAGLHPVCEFMTMNFALQAIDQIINSAAKTSYMSAGKQKVPILFRGPNGAAAGVAAQHSQCFASLYSAVPGLRVLSPWSATDAIGLLRAALRSNEPVILLENEILYGQEFEVERSFLEDEEAIIHISDPEKSAGWERSGEDVCLVAHSLSVQHCMQAAEKLSTEHNIECTVLNIRSFTPLPMAQLLAGLKAARGKLLVVEAGWQPFGIGAEIAARLSEEAFNELDQPVSRLGGAHVPMPFAESLERLALPGVQEIVDRVLLMHQNKV